MRQRTVWWFMLYKACQRREVSLEEREGNLWEADGSCQILKTKRELKTIFWLNSYDFHTIIPEDLHWIGSNMQSEKMGFWESTGKEVSWWSPDPNGMWDTATKGIGCRRGNLPTTRTARGCVGDGGEGQLWNRGGKITKAPFLRPHLWNSEASIWIPAVWLFPY